MINKFEQKSCVQETNILRRKVFALITVQECPVEDTYSTERSKIFRGCSKREAFGGHPS